MAGKIKLEKCHVMSDESRIYESFILWIKLREENELFYDVLLFLDAAVWQSAPPHACHRAAGHWWPVIHSQPLWRGRSRSERSSGHFSIGLSVQGELSGERRCCCRSVPPSVDTNTGCSSSLNPPFKTNDPHAGAISEYIGESNVWCAADTDDTGVSESAGVTLTRLCSALTSVLHLRYGPSREGAPVRRRGRIWGRGGGPQNPGSYSHTSMLVSISICCIFLIFFLKSIRTHCVAQPTRRCKLTENKVLAWCCLSANTSSVSSNAPVSLLIKCYKLLIMFSSVYMLFYIWINSYSCDSWMWRRWRIWCWCKCVEITSVHANVVKKQTQEAN